MANQNENSKNMLKLALALVQCRRGKASHRINIPVMTGYQFQSLLDYLEMLK